MGPHEPYWRTNTSFSPPPPTWDFRFQYEGQSFGSSTSSNSRESRSWLRGNYLPNHHHSASDGVGTFFSSPSDLSPVHQWTPPAVQEISLDAYANSSKRVSAPLSFSPTSKGLSAPHDGRASISSNSDSSDYEKMAKLPSPRQNFTARCCLMTNPVHPLAFPVEEDTLHQRDRFSTASCDFEFSDVSEPIEYDSFNRSNGDKCGLCERFLSQRSPWSSRQIIRSGDMPVTGVLSCHHVFHVECLDQITPNPHKGDPPCPVCAKTEVKNSSGQQVLSKRKNGLPRVRHRGDGASRAWGCAQAGSCVEGAVNAPSRHVMLRIKKSQYLKDKPGGGDGVGCSKSASGSRKTS